MSTNENYPIARSRQEYERLRESRERSLGRGTIYTAMSLMAQSSFEVLAYSAAIDDPAVYYAENGAILAFKDQDFKTYYTHRGVLNDGIWIANKDKPLRFKENDGIYSTATETIFVPHQDLFDPSAIDISELMGAGR